MSRQIVVTFVLALSGVSCAGMRSGAAEERVVVDAVNENYYEARVHAVYEGGQRRSLGTVAGNGGRTRMSLPWEPRPLLFEVLLVTEGSTYVSQSVNVSPGDSLNLVIPSNISESGFFRRVRR